MLDRLVDIYVAGWAVVLFFGTLHGRQYRRGCVVTYFSEFNPYIDAGLAEVDEAGVKLAEALSAIRRTLEVMRALVIDFERLEANFRAKADSHRLYEAATDAQKGLDDAMTSNAHHESKAAIITRVTYELQVATTEFTAATAAYAACTGLDQYALNDARRRLTIATQRQDASTQDLAAANALP